MEEIAKKVAPANEVEEKEEVEVEREEEAETEEVEDETEEPKDEVEDKMEEPKDEVEDEMEEAKENEEEESDEEGEKDGSQASGPSEVTDGDTETAGAEVQETVKQVAAPEDGMLQKMPGSVPTFRDIPDEAQFVERRSHTGIPEAVEQVPVPEGGLLQEIPISMPIFRDLPGKAEFVEGRPHTSRPMFRRLHGCIQAAASRLKDSTTKRCIKRVEILVHLIPKDLPDTPGK